MSFNLSLKNIKKSFKDYAIYFLTLIFGVAIFYIFNSMGSQEAMLEISNSKMQFLDLLNNILASISVFISFVLGFLIVYANNFLIKRRKKEFGIYMTLGMGKRKISKLLLIETILIGIISLAIGLLIGIVGSQFMSLLVAKMFEVDMTNYQFVFSSAALVKTMIYFGIIYVLVMLFNTFAISKCKLIDLLNAKKKNEKVKIKNPVLSVILFLISVGCLGVAYYYVFTEQLLTSMQLFSTALILGVVGTFLFFASLSGFILKIVQTSKRLYLKNLNMFVLRQINSKINTTVVSMSVICIMLFLTICIFSSALSLNDIMKKDIVALTPVDVSFYKNRNVEEGGMRHYTKSQVEDSKRSVRDTLDSIQLDISTMLKDDVEVNQYESDFTVEDFLRPNIDKVKAKFPNLNLKLKEPFMRVSDYNKVARLFGLEEQTLGEDEFIMVCDYEDIANLRNEALKAGTTVTLYGKEYHAKEKTCVKGFVQISPNRMTSGIILVPDSTPILESDCTFSILNARYNAENPEAYQKIEQILQDPDNHQSTLAKGTITEGITKTLIYDTSIGLNAMVTFIGLYLGIIFLITSAAILALKELSDSSDNKERYAILRKIGTDEKMIHRSLFIQIGIFFLMPLLLAIIHSAVGLKFAETILTVFGKASMLPSIIMTAIILIVIYGGYFLATYLCSKAIIKENNN